jgi:xylose isomerase
VIEKRSLSLPFWCVGNPCADPFGPPVLTSITSLEVTDILCAANKERLIDYTAAHDDDLVPWNPDNISDVEDSNSEVYRTLKAIKKRLEKDGPVFKMISCNLHSNTIFRNGGLTNPDPRIRFLAAQKVMRALKIGHFLGAEYFTYWVARDGFETQFAVPWDRVYEYLKDGLNFARGYIEEKNLCIKNGTIEYKPNEPRGEMFLPTVGHAIALIDQLEDSDFWGVNPEVLQHDQMTSLSSIGAVGFAQSLGKLFFLHVGNQKPNQFDNDNPVLVGMDGLKEFVSILYMLNRTEWKGYIEFDNHMLRIDAAPGEENKIKTRKKYIELIVDGYRAAEKKANELIGDSAIRKLQSDLWDKHLDIAVSLKEREYESISDTKIDYMSLTSEPTAIGELDMAANKRLLGL